MLTRFLMVLCLFITLSAAAPASAKVTGREVEYKDGATVLKGYLARTVRCRGNDPPCWWCMSGGGITTMPAREPGCWLNRGMSPWPSHVR